jgi:two-component system, LytTR family, response regulator LytT
MRVLIIEDELPFQLELKEMLGRIDSSIEIPDCIASVEDAIKWFKNKPQPDLLFSDIQLTDGLSFDIYKSVKVSCPVIFTTAFDSYAIKAFELNSIDYLLKPIDFNKLSQSITKFRNLKDVFSETHINKHLEDLANSIKPTYKSRYLVYKGENLCPVKVDDIACFYADEKATILVTLDGVSYIMNTSLNDIEKEVNPQNFYRANRQFIISIQSIKNIKNTFNYKLKIELTPPLNKEIIISKDNVKAFKAWINS